MSAGRFRLRLRHKLAASLVIAALLPVLVAYWVGASVLLRGLERGLRAETEKQLSVGLNLLLRDIERLGHEATHLSSRGALVASLSGDQGELLSALFVESQNIHDALIQVSDVKGEIVARRNAISGQERYAGMGVTTRSPAVQAGLTYERRVTVERLGETLVVRATAPVVDDNFRLLGVVVLTMPLDGLFADQLKASLGADVLIIAGADAAGEPMMSFLDDKGARLSTWNRPGSLAAEIEQGYSAFENRSILGHPYTLGYAPISDIDGRVAGVFAVALDRAPELEARSSATRSLALGAAGAFVFALGLAGLLSRRIARPLQTLHHGAIAIAQGDLDQKISVAEGDEIGDLARAFSQMTGALKENQRRLAARMREIVALHDAGRAVSSVIETDQVLRKVVDSVARVLHLRVCALWLVDQGDDETSDPTRFLLGAARAKRSDMRTIGSQKEVAELVGPLRSLAEDVAASRGSLRVADMREHPQHSAAALAANIDGSLIASVLERKGSVVGVIVVGRGESARAFSDADENLLSTFADQAATAIENANLYARVRRFNEELEAKVQLRTVELQAMNDELGKTITELKETQAQLTLSERLAGLGQLVAGVAHEINSPSAAIRGTADTLADTVGRLSTRQTRLFQMLGPDGAHDLVDFVLQASPGLAEMRRVSPAKVRRASKQICEALTSQKVEEATARTVCKPLAELSADEDLVSHLTPYLSGGAEDGRFVVDTLTDYVSVHRSTRTIQDAIRRIQRIVGSLKSYSHLDQEAARAEADVHEGIENTLVILEYQLSRGIVVNRNYTALPGVPIFVDELNQVWTNLIHNAAQALGGEGQIDIETLVRDDGIAVRIIDNGPGIPGDVMKRIFEPFFTTKAKGEGTGLGLGIVRQIVDKHSGKVICDSKPGRTCFEIWLPMQSKSEEAANMGRAAEPGGVV
ncbi:MAG: GAF domain-containing protein [Myxococcales bacterium]|nr:GAF domain-containing protein [Myxococcales bacterium]